MIYEVKVMKACVAYLYSIKHSKVGGREWQCLYISKTLFSGFTDIIQTPISQRTKHGNGYIQHKITSNRNTVKNFFNLIVWLQRHAETKKAVFHIVHKLQPCKIHMAEAIRQMCLHIMSSFSYLINKRLKAYMFWLINLLIYWFWRLQNCFKNLTTK